LEVELEVELSSYLVSLVHNGFNWSYIVWFIWIKLEVLQV